MSLPLQRYKFKPTSPPKITLPSSNVTKSNFKSTTQLVSNMQQASAKDDIVSKPTPPPSPVIDLANASVIDLLKNMSPMPSLKISTYNYKDSKGWLRQVVNLLSGSSYLSVLLQGDKLTIVDSVPSNGAAADTTLYSRLSKAFTKEQLTIFSRDDENISGAYILQFIAAESNICLTTGQARKKCQQFESMELRAKETLSAYTTRIIQCSKELEMTKYAQSRAQHHEKWRHGLRERFALINDSIDIIGLNPEEWGYTKKISHLLTEARSYIKSESSPATTSHTTRLGTNPRTPSTPTATDEQDEMFQKYVRWMVDISAFENYPVLEKGPTYAGKRPTGCCYVSTIVDI